MKVVRNKVVFFISFVLDCVTTHAACHMLPIPGVEFDGGPEEEDVCFWFVTCHQRGRTVDPVSATFNPDIRPPRRRLS